MARLVPSLRPGLLSVCLVLAGPLAAAAEVLVGPPGSGASFTTIQAALDAAAPGERVRVLAGSYDEHLVISKAVDLVGDDPTAVLVRAPASPAAPAVRIHGVPVGALVRVAGLRLGVAPGAAPIALAEVVDCAGAVELHDLRAIEVELAPVAPGTTAALLLVRGSAPVVVSQCTFTASPLASLVGGGPPADGYAGAWIERSRVYATHTTFGAGWGSTPLMAPAAGGRGGDGLRVTASIVELGAVALSGGEAGGTSPLLAGQGGAGLVAIGSTVRITGGAGALVQGARAVFDEPIGATSRHAHAGAGVVTLGTGALEYAVDAAPAGGAAAGPFAAGSNVEVGAGGTLVAWPERLPLLGYDAAVAVLGGVSRRIYEGEPGSLHVVFASTAGTFPPIDLAGIGSVVCWGPPVIEAPLQVLGATGVLTLNLPVPIDPGLAWLAFVVQSVQWTPLGGLRLSPPTILRIVP